MSPRSPAGAVPGFGSRHRDLVRPSVRGHKSGYGRRVATTPARGAHVEPAVRELSARLLPEAATLGAEMADRILAEIPSYADPGLLAREDVVASCTDNIVYVLGNLAGTQAISIDAPRATGARRAEQGVPYAVVLEAFRVGGRFIWELLVERADEDGHDVLLRAAADIWAVTDELSAAVTDAYRSTLVDRARRDGQMRAVLVGTLLDGEGPAEGQHWEAATLLDLSRDADFVVVSARCPAPGIEALPDVSRVLRRRNVTGAWRLDHEHHEGVVALPRGFGVERLVEELTPLAGGPVGVSAVFSRLDQAADGCRQARLAASSATPGLAEVVRYDDRPLAVLLAGTPDGGEELVRRLLGPVLALPADDAAVILETARTWLASDGSTSTAAKALHLHRNSVRYRLRRLEELTGHDLARPVDAAQLYVALEAARILALG